MMWHEVLHFKTQDSDKDLEEQGCKIGLLGNMCVSQKDKEIRLLNEKQEELTKEHQKSKKLFPWLRPCDPSQERQAFLEREIEIILGDQVVV